MDSRASTVLLTEGVRQKVVIIRAAHRSISREGVVMTVGKSTPESTDDPQTTPEIDISDAELDNISGGRGGGNGTSVIKQC